MQKKEIKNFICSFILSLLAGAMVTKAVFYTPKSESKIENTPQEKIHTISLFRYNNIDKEPVNTQPETVQTAQAAENIDFSAIESLSDVLVAPFTEQSTIDNARLALPQLEILKEKTAKAEPAAPQTDERFDIAYAEPIDLSALEDPVPENKQFDLDVSSAVLALNDIKNAQTDKEEQHAFSTEAIYSPDEEHSVEANIITAENTIAVSEETENFIPLENSRDSIYTSIEVMPAAKHSQIAMLEPNNLINTIDTVEDFESQTIDSKDLKRTENNAFVSEAEIEDSPWVVARGNKYAKNQAVVEQFAEQESESAFSESAISDSADEEASDYSISEAEDLTANVPVEDDIAADIYKEAAMESSANAQIEETLQPKPLLRPIEDETKLAYQMIDNLLIPIPEDIKNDADLTPDLSVAPNEKPKEKPAPAVQPVPEPTKNKKKDEPKNLNEEDKQSGLFKSIAGWFSHKPEEAVKEPEKPATTKKKKNKTGMTYFQNVSDFGEETEQAPIMPAELRLSFQPNRAEISGQTLRWIHAFADNARDNAGVFVEIRIDGTGSFALQKRRLNLLSTILANRGVDFRKINIVFTSREPNSFIIRNIRFSNDEEVILNQNNGNSAYRPW